MFPSPADATIELNLRRLDEDAAGNLVLLAQAAVSFKGRPDPAPRSFRFVVKPKAPGVPSEVAAISAAVGQLADGLAAMVIAGPARPMTRPASDGRARSLNSRSARAAACSR